LTRDDHDSDIQHSSSAPTEMFPEWTGYSDIDTDATDIYDPNDQHATSDPDSDYEM